MYSKLHRGYGESRLWIETTSVQRSPSSNFADLTPDRLIIPNFMNNLLFAASLQESNCLLSPDFLMLSNYALQHNTIGKFPPRPPKPPIFETSRRCRTLSSLTNPIHSTIQGYQRRHSSSLVPQMARVLRLHLTTFRMIHRPSTSWMRRLSLWIMNSWRSSSMSRQATGVSTTTVASPLLVSLLMSSRVTTRSPTSGLILAALDLSVWGDGGFLRLLWCG